MPRTARVPLLVTALFLAAAAVFATSRPAPRHVVKLAKVVTPRDAASGLPTGKRM
jgi:hypothetical protein